MRKDAKFGISDKRGRATTTPDPYEPGAALKEPAFCLDCHAMYHNKSWSIDPIAFDGAENDRRTHWVTCPACRKIADGYPEGIVTLTGNYLLDHEQEIRTVIKREEARVMAKNPLERIMRIEKNDGGLRIETTEQKLAEHIGRALYRSHHGELRVDWSNGHDVCRVHWDRPA